MRLVALEGSTGGWSLVRDVTWDPPGAHRWLGAATVDADGNLALVTAATSTTTHPSATLVTVPVSGDPAEVVLAAGTLPREGPISPQLWAHATALALDPDDGCTLWSTAPYSAGDGWRTLLAATRFTGCATAASDSIFADGFESGDVGAWSGP